MNQRMKPLPETRRTRFAILSMTVCLIAIFLDIVLMIRCSEMIRALRATAAVRPPIPLPQLRRYEGLGFMGLALSPPLVLLIVFLRERHRPGYLSGMKIYGLLLLLFTAGLGALLALTLLYLFRTHVLPSLITTSEWSELGLQLLGVATGTSFLLVTVPYGIVYLMLWLFPGAEEVRGRERSGRDPSGRAADTTP